MIVDDKPPLQGVYIAHFGVRGMKWGQRRKSSDSSDSSNGTKTSNGKKLAIGSAVLGGAAIAAIILAKRGSTPAVRINKVSLKPSVLDKLREAQQMKIDNFNHIKPRLGKMHYLEGNGVSWSPETGTALARRTSSAGSSSNVNLGSIADVRRAWNDPNHVWQL